MFRQFLNISLHISIIAITIATTACDTAPDADPEFRDYDPAIPCSEENVCPEDPPEDAICGDGTQIDCAEGHNIFQDCAKEFTNGGSYNDFSYCIHVLHDGMDACNASNFTAWIDSLPCFQFAADDDKRKCFIETDLTLKTAPLLACLNCEC